MVAAHHRIEPLPAYAPELNPVEPLWSNLKGVELANLAGDTLHDVIAAAERGVQRIRNTHHVQRLFGAEYPVRDPNNFANETLIFICNECVAKFAEWFARESPEASP
jgi:hypothetical protein